MWFLKQASCHLNHCFRVCCVLFFCLSKECGCPRVRQIVLNSWMMLMEVWGVVGGQLQVPLSGSY